MRSTVIKGSALSHVLNLLSHAGATMRQQLTPGKAFVSHAIYVILMTEDGWHSPTTASNRVKHIYHLFFHGKNIKFITLLSKRWYQLLQCVKGCYRLLCCESRCWLVNKSRTYGGSHCIDLLSFIFSSSSGVPPNFIEDSAEDHVSSVLIKYHTLSHVSEQCDVFDFLTMEEQVISSLHSLRKRGQAGYAPSPPSVIGMTPDSASWDALGSYQAGPHLLTGCIFLYIIKAFDMWSTYCE